MRSKYFKIIAGIIIIVLGTVGGNALNKWLQSRSEAAVVAQKMVSKHRPAFSLPDVDGVVRNINEWDGKIIIVNFWATWCPPCRKEIPAFIDLQETYENQGVQFIGVAIDSLEKVQDYIDTMGINYPILIGDTDAIEISNLYGNRFGALPYTAIINRQGEITFIQRGELTQKTAEANIKALM